MATTRTLAKNAWRDQMEYILLISFVLVGSSFVVVKELDAARDVRQPSKSQPGRALSPVIHRHDIFGRITKIHIK